MYRWYALSLLALTYAFSVMDRQIISILLEDLRAEFLLTDTQLGLISGIAFALFYATLGVPIARLADRSNRVNIVSIAVGVWSLATAICGAVTNFTQLFLARIMVGVGEAGGGPPSHSLVSDYFRPEERGFAMSVYSLGTSIGGLMGLILGGFVAEYWGWRWAFVVAGVPGIFLAILVKLSVKEPPRGQFDNPSEKPKEAERDTFWAAVGELWRLNTYRHVLLGHTAAVLVGYAIFSWLAALYIRQFGTGQGEVGSILGGINLFFGVPGLLIGGYLSDRLGRSDPRWRIRISAVALIFCFPLYLVALWQDSQMGMSIFVALAIFCYQLSHAPGLALVQIVVRPELRAVAASFVFFLANLIGLGLGPVVVGYLSDVSADSFGGQSLNFALTVMMFGLIPAIVLYWMAGESIET